MDPGPEGKVFAKSYELSIDSFEELDAEEWLHGLQIAEDGKGEQASHCCGVANAKLTCNTQPLCQHLPLCSPYTWVFTVCLFPSDPPSINLVWMMLMVTPVGWDWVN